jgi:hypothetical protein
MTERTNPPGPLRRVVDALTAGADTRAELSRRTGLSPDVVDGAVEHLMRTGRLRSAPLTSGCPPAGCGHCPSSRPENAGGCAAG